MDAPHPVQFLEVLLSECHRVGLKSIKVKVSCGQGIQRKDIEHLRTLLRFVPFVSPDISNQGHLTSEIFEVLIDVNTLTVRELEFTLAIPNGTPTVEL